MTKNNTKVILAPLGCYEKDFVREVLKAYYLGLSTVQISVYMEITCEEIDHVIDLYLPIVETMGALEWK